MKTMEQKAKAYDDALKRAKECMKDGGISQNTIDYLCNVFPELKESEDEKIRRALTGLLKFGFNDGSAIAPGSNITKEDALAWLEKLKVFAEHGDGLYYFGNNGFTYVGNPTCDNVSWIEKQGDKPQGKTAIEAIKEVKVDNANKIEPKFKIEKGKWYVCIQDLLDNYANIAFYKGDTYVSTQDGSLIPCNSNVPFEVVCPDTYFRDWTIADAKDGDMLYCKSVDNTEYIVMNKGVNMRGHIDSYFRYNSLDGFGVDVPDVFSAKNDNITLATREQRDLLFSKMKEEGYEWDADKKELSKIKQKSDDEIKPKFKMGDWIIHQGTENIYQVVAVIDNQYQLRYVDNYTIQKCDEVDRNARLWNISDAKDGDVLYVKSDKDEWIIILSKFLYSEEYIIDYCSYCINNAFYSDSGPWGKVFEPDTVYPATKEQYDMLFKKIKEEGYEWDAENKVLKENING